MTPLLHSTLTLVALLSFAPLTGIASPDGAPSATEAVPTSPGASEDFPPGERIRVSNEEIDDVAKETFPNKTHPDNIESFKEQVSQDEALKGSLTGRIAEEVFERGHSDPDHGEYKRPKNPNAPQNDFCSAPRNDCVQVKVHKHIPDYIDSMIEDNKAEFFAVPDDHVEPLKKLWAEREAEALRRGDHAGAAEARRQRNRVIPIGRTYRWLRSAAEAWCESPSTKQAASFVAPRAVRSPVHGRKTNGGNRWTGRILVPDELVEPSRVFWGVERAAALARGDTAASEKAMRSAERIVPLGRSAAWLDQRLGAAGLTTPSIFGSPKSVSMGQLRSGPIGGQLGVGDPLSTGPVHSWDKFEPVRGVEPRVVNIVPFPDLNPNPKDPSDRVLGKGRPRGAQKGLPSGSLGNAAFGAGIVVALGGVEAALALAKYNAGEIGGAELEAALVRVGAHTLTGVALGAVLLAAPNAPVLVVIAAGVAVAYATDFAVDALSQSQSLSPAFMETLYRPVDPIVFPAGTDPLMEHYSRLIRGGANTPLSEMTER
jgi:hypothetical protein